MRAFWWRETVHPLARASASRYGLPFRRPVHRARPGIAPALDGKTVPCYRVGMTNNEIVIGAKVDAHSNEPMIGRVTAVDDLGQEWAEVRWTPGTPAYRYSYRSIQRKLLP